MSTFSQGTRYFQNKIFSSPIYNSVSPTKYDINAELGQLWLDTTSENVWILVARKTSDAGTTEATWLLLGNPDEALLAMQADDANVANPDNGIIILHGNHGLNTSVPVPGNALDISINNTITLGDLNALAQNVDALTVTTGAISLGSGNIYINNGNIDFTGSADTFLRNTNALATCHINGITGVATASPALPVVIDGVGKLGTSIAGIPFYETGVFTPTLSFGGASVGIVYNYNHGQYTKIGNILFFQLRIGISNKGTSAGNATVSGIPYPANIAIPTMNLQLVTNSFIYAVGYTYAHGGIISPNNSVIFMFQDATNGGLNQPFTNASFANPSNFHISGFYYV